MKSIEVSVSPEDLAGINSQLQANCRDTELIFPENALISLHQQDCTQTRLMLSNTADTPYKSLALTLSHAENMILDFRNATLECTGQLQPLSLFDSRNVTVRNLNIDWTVPLSAECTVQHCTPQYLDVCICPETFPFEVENGQLFFLTGTERAALWEGAHTAFDRESLCVVPDSGDMITIERAEQLSERQVRLYLRRPVVLGEGDCLVLRHSLRMHAGIFVEGCTNVTFENVHVYATGGLGILCQFNDTLTFRHVLFSANTAKNRKVVNGHDDGLHLVNNRGEVLIEACSFHGLMDDPVNIHGIYLQVTQVPDEHTLRCRFAHSSATGFDRFTSEGDVCALIRADDMSTVGTLTVKEYRLISREECILTFDGTLPAEIGPGDAVENLNDTPAVTVRNSFIGSCRARGLLIITPKKVTVENNLFQSAGSAILLSGDAHGWFESGACHEVTIRDNTFTAQCLTSEYEFCKGVISICPVIPHPDDRRPYHGNITITRNKFHYNRKPVLYAFSTEQLSFVSNIIYPACGHPANAQQEIPVVTEHCHTVCLSDNLFL